MTSPLAPGLSPEELAQAIEKDPTISLRLISVANSPIYRGITEIRNVKTAIPRLGLKETFNVVMPLALSPKDTRSFPKPTCTSIDSPYIVVEYLRRCWYWF